MGWVRGRFAASSQALAVGCSLLVALPTRASLGAGEDAPAEDAPAEDAPAEDAPAEDAPAEDPVGESAPEAGTSPGNVAQQAEQRLIDQAIRHFVEGQSLYDAGRYVDAAYEFERSYAAIRSGLTLYNIALSYEKGGRHVPAIQAAMRYLELPDCQPGKAGPTRNCATRRAEVEQTVERLRRQVGELVLVVEPEVELRQVRVSGRAVPLEDFPLLMAPGPVEVEVQGGEPDQVRTRIVRLNPGETSRLYIGPFESDDPPPRPAITGPPTEDPRAIEERRALREAEQRRTRALRIAFWTGTGFTAVSGVALAVLGGLTAAAREDYDEAQCGTPCVCPEPPCYPFAEEDRFYALRTATNAAVGVTAGLGLVTAVVGIFAFSRGGGTSARRAANSRGPAGVPSQTSGRIRLRWTGHGLSLRW